MTGSPVNMAFIMVKHGNDETSMFNANCTNIVLLNYMKRSCHSGCGPFLAGRDLRVALVLAAWLTGTLQLSAHSMVQTVLEPTVVSE